MPGLGMSPRTSQYTCGRGNVMYSIAERVSFVDMPQPPTGRGFRDTVPETRIARWWDHNAYFGDLNESLQSICNH